MLPHTVKQRSQEMQTQEVQIFTAPPGTGALLCLVLGPGVQQGWGEGWGSYQCDGNLQWCVKCCAPMSQNTEENQEINQVQAHRVALHQTFTEVLF